MLAVRKIRRNKHKSCSKANMQEKCSYRKRRSFATKEISTSLAVKNIRSFAEKKIPKVLRLGKQGGVLMQEK